MKFFFVPVVLAFSIGASAQHRMTQLGLSSVSGFYSYGEGQGSLNNVVRLSLGMSFQLKTIDTVKKSGMVYEINFNNPTAYYKNAVTSNSILEVNDVYMNANFILPIFFLYRPRIQHFFGVGFGVGTLMWRDYIDENHTLLDYNNTTLEEVHFGNCWTTAFMLDYGMDYKLSKRTAFSVGVRYVLDGPVHAGKLAYVVTQGSGLNVSFGLSYIFK
jgi:hypothetical protein